MRGSILGELLERARNFKMSRDEREAQRRSFVFGNANISNSNITREDIDRAADKIGPPRPSGDL